VLIRVHISAKYGVTWSWPCPFIENFFRSYSYWKCIIRCQLDYCRHNTIPRKGSFVSDSRCLGQISSKSVKNCDRESAHIQTDTQSENIISAIHYVHSGEIINEWLVVLKKVKGPDIHCHLKPEQQRFTMWSGVLTSISSRHRSAITAAHCPNKRTLDPQSAVRQTHLWPSQL